MPEMWSKPKADFTKNIFTEIPRPHMRTGGFFVECHHHGLASLDTPIRIFVI